MSDLIDRESAIVRATKVIKDDGVAHDVMEVLRDMPSAQSKCKKGKWIEIMYTEDRTGMKCSECGYRYGGIFGSNYCPHCGADMGGTL